MLYFTSQNIITMYIGKVKGDNAEKKVVMKLLKFP